VVINETPSLHRQAWDLIPWVINGTATPSECLAVEAHLQGCQDCREELEFQRRVQTAMARQSTPELDMSSAWQSLRARLDEAAQPQAEAPRARRLGAGRGWMPWVLAAMVVEAVGLGALGTAVLWRPAPHAAAMTTTAMTTPAAAYRTLAAPEGAPQSATIRVVFSSTMTLAQLQALLSAARLQVVAGPGVGADVWSVGPTPDSNRAATLAALGRLRASPEVRLAEPVSP
jgi:hypothetical protein